jgi:hypothetical protein
LEVELTYRYIFAFKFTLRSQQPNIVPIICHRYQQHKGKLVAKFAAGVVDTGGKFAAGAINTGGKLPPVSLIPVANLDSRISPRIFEKISNGPNGILWGWGETDS